MTQHPRRADIHPRRRHPAVALVCDIAAIVGIVIIPALYAAGINGRYLAAAAALVAGLEYLNGRAR